MGEGPGAREQTLGFPRKSVRRLHCRHCGFSRHQPRDRLVRSGKIAAPVLLTTVGIINWDQYIHFA